MISMKTYYLQFSKSHKIIDPRWHQQNPKHTTFYLIIQNKYIRPFNSSLSEKCSILWFQFRKIRKKNERLVTWVSSRKSNKLVDCTICKLQQGSRKEENSFVCSWVLLILSKVGGQLFYWSSLRRSRKNKYSCQMLFKQLSPNRFDVNVLRIS